MLGGVGAHRFSHVLVRERDLFGRGAAQRYSLVRMLERKSHFLCARTIAKVALAVAVISGLFVLMLMQWRQPPGQMLTVTKPIGGTLSGPGVRCGTLGSDCSVRRPNGDTVELTAQADLNFAFRGYSGDCAPGGLMVMNGARTCGATFEAVVPGDAQNRVGLTQTLTIYPIPTGGTLEGLDILCGTKGSVCSANHPDGVPVELHPTADQGFTFMGFSGDCVPLGHTQMSGPRTCGATFSPPDSLKPGREVPVRPPVVGRGGSPQTPSSPGTQTPTAPTVARGGTNTATTPPPHT